MRSRLLALGTGARSDTVRIASRSWEDLLRPACEMLRRTSAELTRAVTVCGRLNGGDEELLLLLAQAEELATEYGLESDVRLDGTTFSVTFTRDGGPVRAEREDR